MARGAALAVLIALAAGSPAAAEERTPAQAHEAARKQMKDENWEGAAASLRRILESKPGSEEVRDLLPDIEQDLKVCLFRKQARRPSARDLFGPCAKSLSTNGRRLVMEFPRGPRGPEWGGGGSGAWVLPVRFDGDVTVEFRSPPMDSDHRGIFVFLCYDPDKETGYSVVPGFWVSEGSTSYSLPTRITRLEGKEGRVLLKDDDTGPVNSNRPYVFRVSRRASTVEVYAEVADLTTRFSGCSKRWTANDSGPRSGIVGMKGPSISELVVSGTLEEMSFKALLAKDYAKQFQEWETASWRREEVLPAWALEKPVARAAAAPPPLPPDAQSPVDPAIERALAAWYEGRRRDFLASLRRVEGGSPGTVLYLQGLGGIARNAPAQAEGHLDRLVQRFPGFAPGWLYRGMARFHRRNMEGAKQDLDMAWDGSRGIPDLYLLQAWIALREGDPAKARDACAEARRAGAVHRDLDELAEWVRRSLQGPTWVKRFEQKGPLAVIDSDHSQVLCHETGLLISATMTACGQAFPGRREELPPLRVHVFASREGFLEYAAELGRNLESAAGAYIPLTREVVLFVPEVTRESLWRTVKHETFHAFLHGFLDDAPVWFNEGYAQWFENGKSRGETLLLGGLEADAARTLRDAGLPGLTPLKDLLLMDTPTFRKKAGLHYAQALALVQYLNGKDCPYREVLRRYFDSLRTGLSREEAYEAHWAPVLDGVARGFGGYLAGIFREVDGRR